MKHKVSKNPPSTRLLFRQSLVLEVGLNTWMDGWMNGGDCMRKTSKIEVRKHYY